MYIEVCKEISDLSFSPTSLYYTRNIALTLLLKEAAIPVTFQVTLRMNPQKKKQMIKSFPHDKINQSLQMSNSLYLNLNFF